MTLRERLAALETRIKPPTYDGQLAAAWRAYKKAVDCLGWAESYIEDLEKYQAALAKLRPQEPPNS